MTLGEEFVGSGKIIQYMKEEIAYNEVIIFTENRELHNLRKLLYGTKCKLESHVEKIRTFGRRKEYIYNVCKAHRINVSVGEVCIILRVVLYGCETWSLKLREERRLKVFENRVLRRIFGPKRDEVTGEWRKLHYEELPDLYSPDIFRVIKSRRMRWAGHVARMGREEVYTGFCCGNLRGRGHLEDPGVDGRIILRWIFKKWDVGVCTGSSWLRIGTGGGHL